MTDETSIGESILDMPMKRWFLASKRLDMTQEEILNNSMAVLVVAANEKAGAEDGNFDQFNKFLDFGLRDLNSFLGLSDDAENNG